MSVKKKVIILVVSLIGITGIIIGVSYAFFSIGGVQDTANTFNSGCLNISLTNESTSINLTDAYPITDVEGLETTSYDFTVKNNCNSSTNYQINLESLNKQVNSLNADYIKVSLSSDTVDNVISILSSNTSVTPSIDNAYESYNLYTDSLEANEEKTYHLKIWVDYDATVEQAASRVYSSKINVIANPETTVVDTLEAKFSLSDTTLTANLTNNVTSASYCTTTGNICTPSTSATISNNTYTVELEGNGNKQMVCTKLNGTSKVICGNPVEIQLTTLVDAVNEAYQNNPTMFAYDNTVDNNLRYIGSNPNNYVYFNCDDYQNPSSDTCELWRIIGVMNNMETADGTTESLVKLIRSNSIGNYAWDDGNVNDWSASSLQESLNNSYLQGTTFGNGKGITETTRNMIEEAIWKLGGAGSYTSSSNGLASHFYGYERGTTVYDGRPTEWSGKVGLMYPSDYGYATGGGATTDRETCLATELYNWGYTDFDSSDCYDNDWLFDKDNKWALTSSSSTSHTLFNVYNEGFLTGNNSANYNYNVYPSLYLKSNITITRGDGSENSPYTLNF